MLILLPRRLPTAALVGGLLLGLPAAATPQVSTPSAAATSPAPAQLPAPGPAAPAAKPSASVTFPKVVAARYASQSAGRARMHTCLDQYRVNKATNANGGMNWIQKGGGYGSLCTKRLKG